MHKPDSISTLLTRAVATELQAVHQYRYFQFRLDDQGLKRLAGLFERIALEEMGHVQLAAERILRLNGTLEFAPAGPVENIDEPEAMLVKAMAMEVDSSWAYNHAAASPALAADAVTRRIFERMVADEEGHFAEFERQRDNIKRLGLGYLALESLGNAEPPAARRR